LYLKAQRANLCSELILAVLRVIGSKHKGDIAPWNNGLVKFDGKRVKMVYGCSNTKKTSRFGEKHDVMLHVLNEHHKYYNSKPYITLIGEVPYFHTWLAIQFEDEKESLLHCDIASTQFGDFSCVNGDPLYLSTKPPCGFTRKDFTMKQLTMANAQQFCKQCATMNVFGSPFSHGMKEILSRYPILHDEDDKDESSSEDEPSYTRKTLVLKPAKTEAQKAKKRRKEKRQKAKKKRTSEAAECQCCGYAGVNCVFSFFRFPCCPRAGRTIKTLFIFDLSSELEIKAIPPSLKLMCNL